MKTRLARLKFNFFKDVSPVIRFMVLSDTIFIGSMALLGPIFALYINDFIIGGNEAVAGVAAAIYLFTKSGLQIPIAYVLDKIRGEKDDFWIMFVFTVAIAILPLAYLYIDTPLELYIVQFLTGLLTAFTFPSFMAIFTRHIDREKEGMEWGSYYSLTDLTSAGFSAIGGYFAVTLGFEKLIVISVVIGTVGALLLWPIWYHVRKHK